MTNGGGLLPLFLLLSQKNGINEVKQVVREGYILEWDSSPRVATAEREQIVFAFPDAKKKYLRGVSLRNSLREVWVQIILRESTGKPWQNDVHIAASPTHNSVPGTAVSIFTWAGDQPFKGEVRIDVRGNEVADVLNSAICYEVKV